MNENQTIKDRLLCYLSLKGIAPTNFEKTIGAGGSYLNNTKNIGSDKLFTISKYYDDLNMAWLITGEGDMLNNNIHASGDIDINNKSGSISGDMTTGNKTGNDNKEVEYLKKELQLKDKIIYLLEMQLENSKNNNH